MLISYEIDLSRMALTKPAGVSREVIAQMQHEILKHEQTECPLEHTFAPGAYARGIRLPAGTLIVGKIHKHAHLNIVSRGLVTVVTEFGKRQIDAREHPVTFTSEPGTKRALYVQEEAYWTTVHLTESTDLAQIESEIIAPDFEALDAFMAQARQQLLENAT